MVVLAEEAVDGAGSVEDGQIMLASLCVTGADWLGDAVGGQGMALPME